MFNLNYNTHYHLNNGFFIKTLTKLKSNKVIHIERMPTWESEKEYFKQEYEDYYEQDYLTGLINYTTT
jgi:hypothetical protein